MKRIISTVTAAAMLAGALALPAILRAEGKPEGQEGKKGEFAERMREKLGISEEQEAKLKTAKRARRDGTEAAMSDVKAAVRKLHDQLEDKASEKDLSATLDKLVAARKAMRAEEDKFEATLSAALTPTQRAKMVVAMAGHMRGKGGPKGGRGHGGPEQDGPEHDD